ELIAELSRRGVDLIEVGFPYSDPIADGPVIQASYTRALSGGVEVGDIFAGIRTLNSSADLPPLVAMVSFSIIFRVGVEQFLADAAEAGFAGLIVPDLPGDEAGGFFAAANAAGLDLIQLIAPTTTPERAERILRRCSGFVYCVAIAGTTGVREELPETLQTQLKELREKTDLPLAVGFGISRPAQVDALRAFADGVIVGSAIVRQMESAADGRAREAIAAIGEFAAQMTAVAHHET
ncbi:MAG: tryptophan synthase subunit alpha, partial [Planctomycetaceae bacterium]